MTQENGKTYHAHGSVELKWSPYRKYPSDSMQSTSKFQHNSPQKLKEKTNNL